MQEKLANMCMILAAFGTDFGITGDQFQSLRRLSENRNKLREEGFRKDFSSWNGHDKRSRFLYEYSSQCAILTVRYIQVRGHVPFYYFFLWISAKIHAFLRGIHIVFGASVAAGIPDATAVPDVVGLLCIDVFWKRLCSCMCPSWCSPCRLLLALAIARGSATADVVYVIPNIYGFPFCILPIGAWL